MKQREMNIDNEGMIKADGKLKQPIYIFTNRVPKGENK